MSNAETRPRDGTDASAVIAKSSFSLCKVRVPQVVGKRICSDHSINSPPLVFNRNCSLANTHTHTNTDSCPLQVTSNKISEIHV